MLDRTPLVVLVTLVDVEQPNAIVTARRPMGFQQWLARLVKEPITHFFVIGALLFVAYRVAEGDPRTIVVSDGVKADVARRFRDHNGRPPTPPELELALRDWKRDEVLYREALREGLDRDDAVIRQVLADKVRARLSLEVPKKEPSEAELQRFLEAHRKTYELPPRYDYEFVAFSRTEKNADEQREKFERALKDGASPPSLGRPIAGGNLTTEELHHTLGKNLAERIVSLPVGAWQRFESEQELLLVRVKQVSGGLPAVDAVRPLLLMDYARTTQQEAVDRGVQALVEQYRFEEPR